jgi:hypothetical protein
MIKLQRALHEHDAPRVVSTLAHRLVLRRTEEAIFAIDRSPM